MNASIPTSLRLDEPVYDAASRLWTFPIYDSDTGENVALGEMSPDRTVAKINAEQEITRRAKQHLAEAGR